ncbi:MAG: hypothetical protein KO464_01375 [Candidatus Methanofastidiosum sp.]|nr:hypothetical protein [Methanofastidiosum sp.]
MNVFENVEDNWEMDTQAYTETYTKKITLTGGDGEEIKYKLWLISEGKPCKRCAGVRFRYFAEVWDDQNGWIHLPAYDDTYYCSNHHCDEDGLKPSEFEKLFQKIQQNAKRIDLD